jgi:hypothetical protein
MQVSGPHAGTAFMPQPDNTNATDDNASRRFMDSLALQLSGKATTAQ